MKVERVLHADWSVDKRKRQVATARRVNGRYVAEAVRQWGWSDDAVLRLGQPVFVGFDFPLGLPAVYAERLGVDDFLTWLPKLGTGQWRNWAEPATSPEQISPYRPFYPAKAGGSKRVHLLDGLQFGEWGQLLRTCDLPSENRRAAAPMFWLMGAQQVGKAMLTGWRELILPYLDCLALWPFGGDLETLLQSGKTVVAESYPGEFYHHLGVSFANGGKGSQEARAANAPVLQAWAERNGVEVSTELHPQLQSGFHSDDAFDALVGLFGMINILNGNRTAMPANAPPKIQKIEGWILGQTHNFPIEVNH